MEVRVEACARRTPQPDCPLVDTLEQMVAGRRVFVDSVRQVLVFTDGHQVKSWCCGRWDGSLQAWLSGQSQNLLPALKVGPAAHFTW